MTPTLSNLRYPHPYPDPSMIIHFRVRQGRHQKYKLCMCKNKTYMTQHFKQSIMFMHESRLKGEGCLVHCLAGVSRSVTLVVAYIMTVTGLGWQEALAAVRAARPCAGPNLGFQRQLQEFEANQADQFRQWLQIEYKDNPFNDEADIRDLLERASKVNGKEVKKQPSTPPGDI
ncbi:dual specificity protein phosphatase 22-B isoform X2 [Labrus mixtus]|uniref:dual specificity protein phosphatase 22-B isoform X2 n=1 Tax=Labrus mixtus TaxID=508554 RepID=UPI0029C0BAAB|nr:dual specificity protein phosphatase 22-B isoform X2 [Labrus mixtus]